MGIYEEMDVPRIINAMGTFTVYGGSKMSQQTLLDMADAASSFVDIKQFQIQLSKKTALLTRNEAAYYCNSASSGIYLAALACISKKLNKKIRHLTRQDFTQCEIVIFRSHRNPYDIALEQLGITIVELAYSNHSLLAPVEDIHAVLSDKTAAVFYLESGWIAPGAPTLCDTIQSAHQKNVPVILDAAARLPPVENLWNYTNQGVDMVIFSGGKDLHGPQASGLILGRSVYIDLLLESAFPSHGYGRMFKIGREEMAGLYSALKQFLNADQTARYQDAESQVSLACDTLSNSPYYSPERSYPNEAGQPFPRVLIRLPAANITTSHLLCYLKKCSPPIIAMSAGDTGFFLNPMSLSMDEMQWICQKLLEYQPEYNEK